MVSASMMFKRYFSRKRAFCPHLPLAPPPTRLPYRPNTNRVSGENDKALLDEAKKNLGSVALKQNADYAGTLDRPYLDIDSTPDIITRRKHEWTNRTFSMPDVQIDRLAVPETNENICASTYRDNVNGLSSSSKSEDGETFSRLPTLTECISPSYRGLLKDLVLEHFGVINVYHDNIYNHQGTDCLIVPMAPNIMPYRGFGLEILEKGGRSLVREIFGNTKDLINRRIDAVNSIQHVLLDPGDVVITSSHGVAANIPHLAFCIMPYYWQGGPTDAARRLRYTYKQCLQHLGSLGYLRTICVPQLGDGVYGYQPYMASTILMEESVEALLQIEARVPTYNLNRIDMVEIKETTALSLAEALEDMARLWLPHEQVLPAPVYWAQKSRRLLEVTPWVIRKHKSFQKLSFKKHHGVIRNRKKHYEGNLRPYIWRSARCLDPPPLMVRKATGETADYQLVPRPYYYRGVSHELFPRPKSGLSGLRVSSRGSYVGVNKHPKYTDQHPHPKQY